MEHFGSQQGDANYNAGFDLNHDGKIDIQDFSLFSQSFGAQNNLTPSYATGTPFVPETGPAMLHRGEAVIPAKQNKARSKAPKGRGRLRLAGPGQTMTPRPPDSAP